jgi:DUF971 family protein
MPVSPDVLSAHRSTADDGAMSDRQDKPPPWPTEIRLSPDRASLEIDWSDGSSSQLAAGALRAAARDAASEAARRAGRSIEPPADLTITAVNPIGEHAVNLVFSDGHDRAIYPWAYLRELAAGN